MKTRIRNTFFALAIICAMSISVPKISASAADTVVYAEYISQEFAPIIDGEIDDCWAVADCIWTQRTQTGSGGVAETEAIVSFLWNESGLYFLAEVIDHTMNMSDRCNFWVSETYNDEIPQTPLNYPEVDGAWYLCL